jgi:hypothetical protein
MAREVSGPRRGLRRRADGREAADGTGGSLAAGGSMQRRHGRGRRHDRGRRRREALARRRVAHRSTRGAAGGAAVGFGTASGAAARQKRVATAPAVATTTARHQDQRQGQQGQGATENHVSLSFLAEMRRSRVGQGSGLGLTRRSLRKYAPARATINGPAGPARETAAGRREALPHVRWGKSRPMGAGHNGFALRARGVWRARSVTGRSSDRGWRRWAGRSRC